MDKRRREGRRVSASERRRLEVKREKRRVNTRVQEERRQKQVKRAK